MEIITLLDKRLEKPIYIQIVIRYESMAEALEKARIKTGIKHTTTLIEHLIWNCAKDN